MNDQKHAAGTTRRILLTGAAGAIGRCIAPALLEAGHEVRGFDRDPCETLADHVEGDLTDRAAIDRAMAGRNTLVHLAAHPNDAEFIDVLLEPNIIGLHHVLQSAVAHGVDRIVLASSGQVVGRAWRDEPKRAADGAMIDMPTSAAGPNNHYALTKLFAENYGQMLAARESVSVLAVRIGWFPRTLADVQRMIKHRSEKSVLSHDDAQRFFCAAVAADLSDHPGRFAVIYAFGPKTDMKHRHVDLEPGRCLLGFEPRDAFPRGLPESWAESIAEAQAQAASG